MKNRTFRILLRREPEGAYTAFVPAIPGCVTWGETVEEAIAMAKDAIEGCLEVMEEEGIEVVDDSDLLEYTVQLSASIPSAA